jgi:hypothetical protein
MAKQKKEELVKLKAPDGTDEANFGEQRFRVDNDGTILVPKDAAEYFLGVGGFELVKDKSDAPADEVPEGHVLLMHPESVGASWGGKSYEPDDNGAITVPAAAAKDLAHHGFVAV